MNHSKGKLTLALLVGLAATFAVLFLLSTSNTQAANLTVNSSADSGCGVLGAHESITAAISLTSAQSAVTWDNQAAENEAEACTIGIATGDSTMNSKVDGRPVLWKNRDYFERSDTWQASLFRHEPTSGYFSDNHVDDDRYGDSFAYVALSDRGDKSQGGIAEETDFYPRAGVNEKGLGLVQAQAHTLENNGSQDNQGVNNGGLNHWILSRCEFVDEVEQLLRDTNDGGGYDNSTARNTSSLIAVIDRYGNAAIFEADGDSFGRENITKEFSGMDPRPDEKDAPNPPDGGYNGYDYRSNFSHIEFTKPDGFEYFLDECTNEVINDAVVCKNGPDGIDDREDSPSSVKRWHRVIARMDDDLKDGPFFIQKWLRTGGHPRENYLETVARSVGYAPYLSESSQYAWTQEKLVGNHLNRFVTVSSAVIVGSKADDQDEVRLTTMWVALGEPSVAIFVPVFPYAGRPPAVLDDFFLSVNAKRRLVYDYETDADGYPVDNIDDASPYTRLRNYDHSIDLSALFGGNYYGEGGLQAYNFAIEEQLFKTYSETVRTWTATQITPENLAHWQDEWGTWAVEEYVKSDPTVVVYEVDQQFSQDGYISRTHDFTGPTIVEVIANGMPDGGDWPRMRVWVNDTYLTEVGGETGIDYTVVVSPAHATNKAKSVSGDLDGVTSRFALYRYRTTYTGTAKLTVEAVDATLTKTLSIDKIIVRTEPCSVEMYEVEKDWDAKSDTGVRVDDYSILVTDTAGYFDIHHYVWGVPLTIEVVAKGFSTNPDPVISVTCDLQLVGTATLTTEYAVYAFNWDPGSEGLAVCRIQTGNYKDIRVDKLLMKESLPVNPNTAPIGCFTVDIAPVAPIGFIPITATAVVTDPDGDTIASYFWDFGDGESHCSGNPVVTHTYKFPETPSLLTLYATDHRGKTAIIRHCVYLPIIMKNHS